MVKSTFNSQCIISQTTDDKAYIGKDSSWVNNIVRYIYSHLIST